VRDRLHGNEIDYGLLLGSFGIGSIAAALIVAKARRRFGTETVLSAATIAFAVAQIDLAMATQMAWALPGTFIAGGAWVASLTTINVAMQMRSPDNILGRCLSIYQAVTFGGMAIGAWFWGAMADFRDLQFALCLAAAFLVVSLVILRIAAPMPKPSEGRIDRPR
jgi:predicted MFS family arabinose efflux permease